MNIVAIVQARMTSSRLKGKVLLQLGSRLVIEHVVDRLSCSSYINKLVVATTNDLEDKAIVKWAKLYGIHSFCGDREDVLTRFYECAVKYDADVIVRVTSDNPLIDPDIVDQTISAFLESGGDFAANNLKKTFPWGLDVEVISFDALSIAYRDSITKSDREHVTQFVRHRPERFDMTNVKAPENHYDIRLTLDEMSDFELISKVFLSLGDNANYNSIVDLFKRQPELFEINLEARMLHNKYNKSFNLI
jgi:spore coat polysaccharide biosynthesis protein SpsF